MNTSGSDKDESNVCKKKLVDRTWELLKIEMSKSQ